MEARLDPLASDASASVALEGVTKTFAGGVTAVDDVSFHVGAGEFFSLLGPSGCGKTTTLRMVAGFETPNSGRIVVGGRDLTGVPVHRRNMGMVFQSYALLPHKTVAENVAFGLRMRGRPKEEIAAAVGAALEQVKLAGYGERRPGQLSGGQQQRVALARAIVIRPPVLLCDEPLGALDRKLRQALQIELKELQHVLGLTLLFVTHDQEEALAMSDRIAIMSDGKIEQIGSPQEVYQSPTSRFVAGFIGEINMIDGSLDGGRFEAAGQALPSPDGPNGPATLVIRPEKVKLGSRPDAPLGGTIIEASFLGAIVRYIVEAEDGTRHVAEEPVEGSTLREPGTAVGLSWRSQDAMILPPESS